MTRVPRPADAPLDVSVVLPTYNEAASIVPFLRELLAVLDRCAPRSEALILDDASPDGTAALVREAFAGEPRVVVVSRTGARGLAFSIREGLSRACGERMVVMDSDFNHDPQAVPALLDAQRSSTSRSSATKRTIDPDSL